MKKQVLRLLGAAIFAISAPVLAASALISPAELKPLLSVPTVRVIDIRDPKSFAANHIPGAVNAPYGAWRGPASNPGALPPLPKLTQLVQSLGLTAQTHAVVVSSGQDATDFGASARVYWTLKVLGIKELSVLNGGVVAWTAAKLPQNTDITKPTASDYQPKLDGSLIATKEEVVKHVSAGDSSLVDARPAAFYAGETRHQAARTPGTLQGAVNLPFSKFFEGQSAQFVSVDKARQVALGSKLESDKITVSFCNTGHWAATNWFAMSEVLGQKNVKLYPGSMVEWTADDSVLPMDNVPNRIAQLVIDAKLWSARTFK